MWALKTQSGYYIANKMSMAPTRVQKYIMVRERPWILSRGSPYTNVEVEYDSEGNIVEVVPAEM